MTNIAQSVDEALSRTKVLDKGEVALLWTAGGDYQVIAAARVSNGITKNASKGQEADQKLINYLMKHRHGTPFEHSEFEFYVKCPIFVAREWQRHRISSFNEISGRYVEFKPEFYIPDLMRIPAQSNKQGSVLPSGRWAQDWYAEQFGPSYSEEQALQNWNGVARASIEASTEQAWLWYEDLVHHKGVAKEMARMVLPLNLYTEFYYKANARSLMNFLSLRTGEDAQWEIRQYALAMKYMFAEAMPMTYLAWENNAFLAP